MNVTRERREVPSLGIWLLGRSAAGRRTRLVVATTAALAVAGGGVAAASTTVFGHNHVGTQYADGLQVSADQVIKPIGQRLSTPFGKIMGSTISPDGRYLAATSTDRSFVVQIFDLRTYKPVALVGTLAPAAAATAATNAGFPGIAYTQVSDGSVGQEGPTFSPDGTSLWVPQANGLTRFGFNADGTIGAVASVPIAADATGHQALPARSVFSADGATLYVPVNGQNRVVAVDAATGVITRSWAVGTAPRAVVLVGSRLYVSNEGGRAALPGETTINSYGTQVPADPRTGAATTGTVSVVDTARPSAAVRSIAVGLHPTALKASGRALFVTNTDDDTVSVIDTRRDVVVQTIDTKPWKSATVGYQPNGVELTKDGHLLVTLGRANAVAVYNYHGDPQQPVNLVGLLPTDYYPADVAEVRGQVVVTNTRGIDARGPLLTYNKGQGTTPATGHGTHATTASLTRFTLPRDTDIAKDTATVFAQNGWGKGDVVQAVGRHAPAAVPVPARLGDPSTIKHVFLLVKENRTYDQVYGDLPQGDGDPTLAQFGARVTPNQHALAQQFGLYDNAYDIGTNSAEGHNWIMQGDNPEYTESSAGEYLRSHDTEDDVLGHQRSGFLWSAVQAAGGTVRNFGEFTQFETKPATATWQQYYCAADGVTKGADPSTLLDPSIRQDTESPIPSLNAVTNHDYPKFDTAIPDTYRFEIWKQDFEKNGPASLNTFWLSSDHTGGPVTPEAQVADGDVAVGKIVDEISHSPYWKDSAIFVVEDDSQDGADHVDGHRAPIQVISPYAQHGVVDSSFYSQIAVVRTIEQILGAQPLNQKVAAASPMSAAFTRRPDLTPFTAVANQVPLTEGLAAADAPACGVDTLGQTGAAAAAVTARARAEAAVPASATAVAAAWKVWASAQRFTGATAVPDHANPEQMNRYTWYQSHHWTTPYPGDTTVYSPDKVPGAFVPSADQD